MLLVLPPEVKAKLKLIESLEPDIIQEFCRISVEYLKGSVKPKVLKSAEIKLGLPADSVESCVLALLYLLQEASGNRLTELEFVSSLSWVTLSAEQKDVLKSYFLAHREDARLGLRKDKDAGGEWRFDGLEWRLDMEVAAHSTSSRSRECRLATPRPLLTMELKLRQDSVEDENDVKKLPLDDGAQRRIDSQCKAVILQTDPSTLKEMVRQLETALREGRNPVNNKIARALR